MSVTAYDSGCDGNGGWEGQTIAAQSRDEDEAYRVSQKKRGAFGGP